VTRALVVGTPPRTYGRAYFRRSSRCQNGGALKLRVGEYFHAQRPGIWAAGGGSASRSEVAGKVRGSSRTAVRGQRQPDTRRDHAAAGSPERVGRPKSVRPGGDPYPPAAPRFGRAHRVGGDRAARQVPRSRAVFEPGTRMAISRGRGVNRRRFSSCAGRGWPQRSPRRACDGGARG